MVNALQPLHHFLFELTRAEATNVASQTHDGLSAGRQALERNGDLEEVAVVVAEHGVRELSRDNLAVERGDGEFRVHWLWLLFEVGDPDHGGLSDLRRHRHGTDNFGVALNAIDAKT